MGTYLRKYEQLSSKEIEEIEHKIWQGGSNFKELATEYRCFDDVITKIANNIGITNDVDDDDVEVTADDEKVVTTGRKRRVSVTPDMRKRIKADIDSGKYTSSQLVKKYNVSLSTIGRIRIAKEDKATVTAPVTTSSVVEELVPLSNYIAIKTLSVRIDPTVKAGGVNISIFDKAIGTLKSNYNFEKDIAEFFEKNVERKGVNILKIYFSSGNIDFNISTNIVKHCMMLNCNLTFVVTMRENVIIDSFCETNKNLQRIAESGMDSIKLLYKTDIESVKDESKSLYILHMIYMPSVKQVIICDEFEKLAEILMKLQIQYKDTQYKAIAYKLSAGNQFTLFTTATQGFIDK